MGVVISGVKATLIGATGDCKQTLDNQRTREPNTP